MRWPLITRKRYDAEVARLEAIVEKALDPKLTGLNLHGTMLQMGFQGGAAQLLADAFVKQFKDGGATNYLELSFHHNELGRIVVTVQRAYGKTPADKAREAEQRLAACECTPKSGGTT